MKRILVTAFEPFGGSAVNTSAEVCRMLPDIIGGCSVEKEILPVVFLKAAEKVLHHSADMLFLLGEAGGRFTVTPETRAVNIRNARIPDNEGNQPKNEKILDSGPAEYSTVIPARLISDRMREEGYDICVSDDAGTYVCNETFYLVGTLGRVPAEFIHVPAIPERSDEFVDTVKKFIEMAVL